MDICHVYLKAVRLALPRGKVTGQNRRGTSRRQDMSQRSAAQRAGVHMAGGSKGWNRSEVGLVRRTDRACPVRRELTRFCPGLDTGDRLSLLRFVLEHITDIAAIEGHAGLPFFHVRLRLI
jgi:hypothetical protein